MFGDRFAPVLCSSNTGTEDAFNPQFKELRGDARNAMDLKGWKLCFSEAEGRFRNLWWNRVYPVHMRWAPEKKGGGAALHHLCLKCCAKLWIWLIQHYLSPKLCSAAEVNVDSDGSDSEDGEIPEQHDDRSRINVHPGQTREKKESLDWLKAGMRFKRFKRQRKEGRMAEVQQKQEEKDWHLLSEREKKLILELRTKETVEEVEGEGA
jgi:hypothetical protein